MKSYRRAYNPYLAFARRILIAGFVLAIFAAISIAQSPKPRIATRIDDSVRAELSGSVPRLARAELARPEYDQGEAPAATEMRHMRLVLSRTPEQEAALDRDLNELGDKSSPNYERWLTPEQFGKLYGPAEEDLAAISNWLAAEGLTGIALPKSHSSIEFSGTVSQIEQTFHTSIHSFNTGKEEFLANVTDPSLPAALTPVVKGILHMDTILPESFIEPSTPGRYDAASKRFAQIDSALADVALQPQYTPSGIEQLDIVPADAATIYNTPNKKLNANFSGGANYDGTGVTIGIGGIGVIKTSTVVNYRKLFLGNSTAPTLTNVGNDTSTKSVGEAYLDLEVSGGLAPGAAIHYYLSNDLYSAITQMLDDNKVDIFSLSFGLCEQAAGNMLNQTMEDNWKQAATQGITVVVSSGDSGSAGCDNAHDESFAYQGVAVSGFASTPYNIAVGGTDFYALSTDFSNYVDSTSTAANFYRSALKPIPESPWNDESNPPGPLSTNQVNPDLHTIAAGSGGASSCITQTTANKCTAGYPKPSWQTGHGVPADHLRDIPDVSLMAGNGLFGAVWLICDDTGGNCTPESGGSFSFDRVGGTSASAPAFAGILALVEQKQGKRLGSNALSQLYSLFNIPAYASKVFNDIAIGNNSVECYQPSTAAPSPDCKLNKAGYYFESAYNAGPGYDQASGLGSVNATNLVEFWGAASPLGATVTVKPAASTIFRGDSLAVSISVTGKSGTPTGTVKLSGGGYTSKAVTLSNGKATIIIPASVLAIGADTLAVTYSGDSKFASATGDATLTVTQLTPTVTVIPASKTVSRAKSLLVTVKVTASIGKPAGTVTLSSGSYKSAATTLTSGEAKITIPADKLTAGKATLTATYKASPNYKATTGQATVTVAN